MRRRAHRTALTALLLAAGATACLTGCQSGQDGDSASDGPARSTVSGGSATASPSSTAPGSAATPAGASASASAPDEPFAGLTGAEISERALKATTGARSLRMTGSVPDDESGGTIEIDLALDRRGDCAGTMGLNGQGEAELIKTGDTVYLKYDERFLRAQSKGEPQADTEALVSLLAGRWTSMSADGADAKEMAGFCDLDKLLEDAGGSGDDTPTKVTRGKATTVDGKPAFTLYETDGSERNTVYVATEGEPYLLRFESGSKREPGALSFTGYDEPVPAASPSGEVLDLDGLTGTSA
ncbi:hypothetical protein C4J65_12705 [Streptomyces sp. CB09001]|uniref:hypothetical protein n=1 Tax=Streptomyces sp. CB09001 TaxID=2083284 RepID=UPI000E2195BD|nr:hypothetical protein [Streptomyces sp. CB09001]AXL89073.1 hypothetical protein C4J65_12705 [Streptomyces sp. CB09001]